MAYGNADTALKTATKALEDSYATQTADGKELSVAEAGQLKKDLGNLQAELAA